MNSKSKLDSGLNQNQKDAITYSRKLFEQLERVAAERNPDRCLTAYRLLRESMERMTGIDRKQIESIMTKAREFIEPTLMQKIDSLLERAMEAARAGDLPNCRVFSKIVKEWNDQCRTIISKPEFWDAVHKQLAIIAETGPRGTSSQARKDGEESGQTKATVFQNEKRRYLRYAAPDGLWVKFPPSTDLFRVTDISMEGMQVLGSHEQFVIGKKINMEVVWKDGDSTTTPGVSTEPTENQVIHRSMAQVVRLTEMGVGLFFEQLKGPTLFLVKERHIDLNLLAMVLD
ncbi:MAG: hypothetical protein ORO03_04830 [Alphaproteobacteria bacterium]|nr:hypothetical protein [Alphaproteobacteria bacterium]